MEDKKVIAGHYVHISNSGIKFEIVDAGNNSGSQLIIRSSAFGDMQNEFKLYLNKDHLAKLSAMFALACNYENEKSKQHTEEQLKQIAKLCNTTIEDAKTAPFSFLDVTPIEPMNEQQIAKAKEIGKDVAKLINNE